MPTQAGTTIGGSFSCSYPGRHHLKSFFYTGRGVRGREGRRKRMVERGRIEGTHTLITFVVETTLQKIQIPFLTPLPCKEDYLQLMPELILVCIRQRYGFHL